MTESNHSDIAAQILDLEENIVLIYAFNATGKTRLSVEYKDATKNHEGEHEGVYYNALSEDLFIWQNESDVTEARTHLELRESSLNKFHSSLTEDNIREKLKPYKHKYDFKFSTYEDDQEKGIEFIKFFILNDEDETPIKISRGEERIFIWCFYLALFEVEGWADTQDSHFFIDDPVSSLDDHNIFVTATTIFDLIETHFKTRKLVVTTHHIGLFSILSTYLAKGENSASYKKKFKTYILAKSEAGLALRSPRQEVLLYHLHVLKILIEAKDKKEIYAHHFVLLRQVLENLSSFLGAGHFGYVLSQIELSAQNRDNIPNIVNTLSHKNIFYYESNLIGDDNKKIIIDVLNGIMKKYNFKI